MQLLVNVPDNKADLMLEILKSISFVKKAETLSPSKAAHLDRLKEAVREVTLIKKGLKKGIPIKDVLDEL